MNMRTLIVVLGAAGALAVGNACVVTGTGNVGGSGGTGGDTTSTTTSTTTSASSTAGVGGGGGTGGGAACYDKDCATYITDNPPESWCDEDPNYTPGMTNPSYDLYIALADCTCTGACMAMCMDNACKGDGTPQSAECATCVADTNAGCGKQFNECANDAGN